ncbi:DNA-directed RNA polymerase subunit beta [Quillaja saponaria]|uniref:DNA-directed RNA polymerase subunit beta n=1 Tax=Quillaja saponaria TaxID=32244 RepID=A0AAD7PSF4_QUISA|nr:DNA-directed RNA polymerase subunit beta [Quillaja saponaria]
MESPEAPSAMTGNSILINLKTLKSMGVSADAMGVSADVADVKDEIFTSKGGKYSNRVDMDIDSTSIHELGQEFLKKFCKEASVSFFDEYGLISHQINSYNHFIKYGLQKTFDSFGELIVDPGYDPSKKGEGGWRYVSLKFGKVTLEPPTFWGGEGNDKEYKMLPRHARLQRMTYSARMKVNVHVQVYTQKLVRSDKSNTGEEQCIDRDIISDESRDIIIGRIPVMVKSDLCWMKGVEKDDCDFDHGGYFLIKGTEKTFIAQEQIYLKKLWLFNNQGLTVAHKSHMKRNRLIIKLVGSPKVDVIKVGALDKVLRVYFFSIEIPVWILFFALGVSSDREVIDLIDYSIDDSSILNILFASIRDADEKCDGFRKGQEALSYVDKLIRSSRFPPVESTEECLRIYVFPSLGGLKHKARFLGYMVKCLLLTHCGRRRCDDRDDFRNKRLDLAGELLERELRVHIAHARRRMTKAMQRDLYGDCVVRPIEQYLDASILTNGLTRAFSTGAWSHPFKMVERISGVVATVGRTNPLQTMVDMRKTRQQVQYAGKVGGARYPHPSHWGKVCFLSTPDGENCGLVKNLAVTGLVSTNISEPVVPHLFDFGMEELVDDTSTSLCGIDKVFLNGDWVGVCKDSLSFVAKLRNKRRGKELPHQVEIKRDEQQGEVRIYSDAGRILRPLLVVDNLHKIKASKGGTKASKEKQYFFQSLLDLGVIELVGPEEEEDCCTAWAIQYLFAKEEGKPPVKYTHCELDMSFLLGLSCGIIPFANHNQARRVLFQAQKHSSQAIGYHTTNPNLRVDTLSHQLHYPQKPLFCTMVSDCLGKPEYPLGYNGVLQKPEYFNGQNAIVAVNVHLGYNQEDSLVMNLASMQRGMFRSEHIRSYKAEVDNKESLEKRRKLEDSTMYFGKSKIDRGDSLDDDGFPFIGANLQSKDIIIGRCSDSGADHSIKLKHTERGYVQKVVLSSSDDGKNFAVVSLKQVRSPTLGDKFSSMHGQKGVLGFLESQENFPFTIQGIVPDIVINPHAFPTRTTPGQLLEAALGKGIACGGSLRHATPFSTLSVDAITDQLHRVGFSRWGSERVYNGRTGEMVDSLIFMGPTFYQRLTHMSEDKVKFRNTGPVHPLTRQPVAERKRLGGVKFGEMERDCLLAHGASANLHERLFALSDPSQMHICRKCKSVVNVIVRSISGGRKIRGPFCRGCESVEDIVKISVPYGAKLLWQELLSMGISLKFETRLC